MSNVAARTGALAIESIVEQLPHSVGRRIRDERTGRGWTLDQLAQSSGVSRRMIVNVEAGRSNASIATLLRLAMALEVSLAEVVTGTGQGRHVVRTTSIERAPLWRGAAGGTAVMVASADSPGVLELWEWHLEPGEVYSSEPHGSGTRELIHVRSGQLTLTVGVETLVLRPGDSASFIADVSHEYAGRGRGSVRFTMAVLEQMGRVRS